MSASEASEADSSPASRQFTKIGAHPVASFDRVAVVGGGYMGGGIAQTFALCGIETVLVDADAELSARSVRRLLEETDRYESAGLFPAGSLRAAKGNLSAARSLGAAVREADYVAEAVPEERALKEAVLQNIAREAPMSAVIASNTSAIPIADLATSVSAPERFLGVHWMNPAPFVPCVEVIPSATCDPGLIQEVVVFLRAAGKVPTVVTDSPGFVANRLQYALFKECLLMMEEGIADSAQIDEVVRNSFGFRLPFFGPFAIADIAGIDVYAAGFATMESAFGDRMATPRSLVDLLAEDKRGLKSLNGFFSYGTEDAERIAAFRDHAYSGLLSLRSRLTEAFIQRSQEVSE